MNAIKRLEEIHNKKKSEYTFFDYLIVSLLGCGLLIGIVVCSLVFLGLLFLEKTWFLIFLPIAMIFTACMLAAVQYVDND